jgi:hypothetical protein
MTGLPQVFKQHVDGTCGECGTTSTLVRMLGGTLCHLCYGRNYRAQKTKGKKHKEDAAAGPGAKKQKVGTLTLTPTLIPNQCPSPNPNPNHKAEAVVADVADVQGIPLGYAENETMEVPSAKKQKVGTLTLTPTLVPNPVPEPQPQP